ncbi:PEP-CTERM sorting domain-containing protein [Chitiniphilus purpureus]|uniref:PEP-CTERM sorting domain-containing protein n=1 Tax=Chitiniphilus purpureus TaxID=2981137 RepID=A0ABY6DH09_9NEIS|nr:PEP-CTERM sorting domain-containing protein [Chitiniphilus sp. CD1]UXY13629.1 PEP-CTERM sorting domain-containing protein [Chitiniphilus sp. CD1]
MQMKYLSGALAIALSPAFAQAALIDVLGMLTLNLDGPMTATVSQANVVRDNYSFIETTVRIAPNGGGPIYLDSDWGALSATYSLNIRNNAGYAVSGFSIGASQLEKYSVKYYPVDVGGTVSHQQNGQQVRLDHGIPFTEPDSDYFLHTWVDFASYGFAAQISPNTPQTHSIGVNYAASLGEPNPGWGGYAYIRPAEVTFSIYDPRTVVPVPEPATYALTGLGLLALWPRRRKTAGVA